MQDYVPVTSIVTGVLRRSHCRHRRADGSHSSASVRADLAVQSCNVGDLHGGNEMRRRILATISVALVVASGTSYASSIDLIFSTADGCGVMLPPYRQVSFRVYAILYNDAATGGITGAEFRIDNWPANWFSSVSMSPAASLMLGHPLTGGCKIGFPSCQVSASGYLLLCTVDGFATTTSSSCPTVDRHQNPSNPLYMCPLLVLCDAPVYTAMCVCTFPCTIAVEPATWSAVKVSIGRRNDPARAVLPPPLRCRRGPRSAAVRCTRSANQASPTCRVGALGTKELRESSGFTSTWTSWAGM